MAKDLYRIGITGSYGGLNLGDEAILHSIIAQLRRDLPVEITVFSRDPEDTKRRHGVERAVPVRKMSRAEAVPEVERLDLLVVGGGGILFDAEARIYLREAQIAKEKGVPVMLYAVGAGPLKHASAQAAVRDRPGYQLANCILAANAAMAGQPGEARKAIDRVLKLTPGLRLADARFLQTIGHADDLSRWVEALRQAGLPE